MTKKRAGLYSLTPCHTATIVTPKKIALKGLWFGKKTAPRVLLWVHGLGSSAFSMQHIVEGLVDTRTSILTFNNRGHDVISRIARVGKNKRKTVYGGSAHEIFTDCIDDIEGAIRFARARGAKEIYLAGHSTGCQKSIYWAAKGGKGVKGIILLAPVSDWAAEMKRSGPKKVLKAVAVARALVKRGKKHELLPKEIWHAPIDAQRVLSLCTPESVEELFPYSLPMKSPTLLKKVRTPILVLWAEKDEFSDQPSQKILRWFEKSITAQKTHRVAISGAGHSFKTREKEVCAAVRQWIRGLEK